MDSTARFYSQPSYVGGGFPVFAGSRRQRGGGVFGSIAKAVLPALKSVGKSILRRAGSEALGLASDLATSGLTGRGIKQTLKQQGLKRLKNIGHSALQAGLNTITSARSPPAAAPPPPPSARATPLRKRRLGLFGRGLQAKRRRRGGGATATAANF